MFLSSIAFFGSTKLTDLRTYFFQEMFSMNIGLSHRENLPHPDSSTIIRLLSSVPNILQYKVSKNQFERFDLDIGYLEWQKIFNEANYAKDQGVLLDSEYVKAKIRFREEIYNVNKNVVLVLVNGRPLNISWADENIPAIVEAWQLGSQAGNAIAQVLYGDYNPSGKLTMSFPRNVGQVPIYYNYKNTGRPGPGGHVFWSHYNDEKNEPLYPFGHGLSYSSKCCPLIVRL